MMYAAFYDGTRKGLPGMVNRVGRFFSGGSASHTEIVFSDGMSGSSEPNLGVRLKKIPYTSGNWFFVELPASYSEKKSRDWYEQFQLEIPYDYLGCLRFGLNVLGQSPNRAYCTESNLMSAGIPEAWRYCPNGWLNLLRVQLGEKFNVTRNPPEQCSVPS